MVLKLFGFPMSTCTRRVAVTLVEKKIPFEFVLVDISTGAQKNAEYLKKQPFGQVPYIDDDGFILFESRAIARYLAVKYAGQGTPGLIPVPTSGVNDAYFTAVGKFEEAASIEQANFDAFAGGLAAEKVFKPRRGGVTNEAHVEGLTKAWEGKMDAYEKILAKQKYLAGDNLTIVDLYHLPYGSMAISPAIGIDFTAHRPNVARWWNELASLPSWQKVSGGVESVSEY